MKHLQIKDNLFLVQQAIENTVTESVRNMNHIWLIDRSGSMYNELPKLIDDLKIRTRSLHLGDTFSFGWFSSEGGDYHFPIKGFKLTEEKDFVALDKIFDANKEARNMTCFSEILENTVTVIEDLTPINPNFSLVFFSDGYPVVSNYGKEIRAINSALSALSAKVNSALLVGYGSYFNKELMGQMAERVGGVLASSKNIHAFAESLDRFLLDGGSAKREMVTLSQNSVHPFAITLTQNNVISLLIEDGQVAYSPTGNNDAIYYLVDGKSHQAGEFINLSSEKIMHHHGLVDAAYATSLALIQRTKVSDALDILSVLGDKAFIKDAANAFTNDEYANVENRINAAVFNSGLRLSEGRDTRYLPPADAFCLVDAVESLLESEDARFYPYHPSFDYKRIGRKSKQLEGYPKFERSSDASSPISDLVWNKTQLNLSIRARIQGTVKLKGDYASQGFAETYPTFIYRNYSVVKDGFLNTPLLPISHINEDTYNKFREVGIIDDFAYSPDGFFILNLAAVPVMNRAMATGRTSATALCKQIYREKELEGSLKGFKFFRGQLNPDKKAYGSPLNDAQQEFLKSNGIGSDGAFSPKSEELSATDHYFVKSFEVKVGGLSNLPKVDAVMTKLDDEKKKLKLTISDKMLVPAILNWQAAVEAKKEILPWLDGEILAAKKELATLRGDIQRTKFAILLGKAWFDEFTSRSDNKIKVNDVEYTFEYRDNVKVDI